MHKMWVIFHFAFPFFLHSLIMRSLSLFNPMIQQDVGRVKKRDSGREKTDPEFSFSPENALVIFLVHKTWQCPEREDVKFSSNTH